MRCRMIPREHNTQTCRGLLTLRHKEIIPANADFEKCRNSTEACVKKLLMVDLVNRFIIAASFVIDSSR